MKRFNVAGWSACGAYKGAVQALKGLSVIFPAKISVDIHEYETRDEYMTFLAEFRSGIGAPEHKTSPIVWFEAEAPSIPAKYLGGRDDTLTWCRKYCSVGEDIEDSVAPMADDGYVPNHGYDYDVVVIGGGSGGLACSKEARKLGAKVAVLDFVKPSPKGSKWGLGGTCVNVGCIPKKLMHNAALLGEAAKDAVGYGWQGGNAATHSWETLRENVQDHIKSLNFGYRVSLRENGVTYLNQLGRFVGPHELECVDAKGKVTVITSARFVVAVGGRPSPLDCPGGELAISSDDLFSLDQAPGKTCVVGAGYVALECAGFIAGLNNGTVTVLVRSILLRGFDRQCVEYVQTAMEDNHNLRLVYGVLPTSIAKQPSGKLLVTFSNGGSDEFDTVLVATGRYADTNGLQLDRIGIQVNAKTGKIVCANEQTNVPHAYAIGDIIHGGLELTPVAILAGRKLARRLFGNSPFEFMDYSKVATTVFTPLELGTVGLSEEAAIEKYGAAEVDSYISTFQPLEWTIAGKPENALCFTKIVIKKDTEKVLGIHMAAPNAGEITQGFAVALTKGITYRDLINTVGIHPTIAEEFTVMEIAKSSGADASKKGC